VSDQFPLLEVTAAPHDQLVDDTGTQMELLPLGCHINTVEKPWLTEMLCLPLAGGAKAGLSSKLVLLEFG
jgi:hypothetical protein